jgi:hypothetical protein
MKSVTSKSVLQLKNWMGKQKDKSSPAKIGIAK